MVVSAEGQMKVDACELYMKFMLLHSMLCLSVAVVVLLKELIMCLLFQNWQWWRLQNFCRQN